MSTMNVDQVLAQMRTLAAQAANQPKPAEQASGEGFGDLLKQSINSVNEAQQHSSELKTSFELGEGDVNLAQVMIASQKASLSFQAMVQVRNKLVEAYKDVMNMPI
ncbi:MAG: flagellar hook-basal body complex protein FliE [Chromatiales bacterium]|nr:flagellar hook-basal body complex protein FliE [Chromatiales bacterium]